MNMQPFWNKKTMKFKDKNQIVDFYKHSQKK